jgi:hypothetical protein
MSIPRTATIIGVLLILVTVFTVISGVSNYFTAFLPGIAGLVLAVLGVLAEQRASMRHQLMHIAVAVALIAALGSLRLFTAIGNPTEPQAEIIAQVMTLVLSGIFLVIGVQSFIAARRARG